MLKKLILIISALCLVIASGSVAAAWTWDDHCGWSSWIADSSVVINSGNMYTNNREVTLTITTDNYSPPSNYNLKAWLWNGEIINANNWSMFNPDPPPDKLVIIDDASVTTDFTLSSGDGDKKVWGIIFAYFGGDWNWGGVVSTPFEDTIILDTTSPEGTISIDYDVIKNGVPYTRSPIVTLNLTANDNYELDKIKIWNDQLINEPDGWINRSDDDFWSFTESWTLSANDGTKKVYVKFKDKAGNESDPYHDTITLDTTSPEGGSIAINNDDPATTSNVVELNITLPSDNISGPDQIEMWIEDSPSNYSSWIPLATTYSEWQLLPSSDGIRQVRIKFRDAAENETGWIYSQEIIVDKTPPVPGQPPISVQGATEYDGTNYVTDPDVVLNIDATDNYHPIKMFITHTEQELSNNDGRAVAVGIGDMERVAYATLGGGDDGWLDYDPDNPTHQWPESLNSGLLHTFKVKFKDSLGNTDDVWYEYSVIYDATPPTGEVSIIEFYEDDPVEVHDGEIYTPRTKVKVHTENVHEDASRIKIYGEGNDVSKVQGLENNVGEWIDETYGYYPNDPNGDVVITLDSDESSIDAMTKQIYVQFKDKAGNVSGLIPREVILDTQDPAIPTITSPSETVQDITQIAGEASDIIEILGVPQPGGSGIASVKVRIKYGSHDYWYKDPETGQFDWVHTGIYNWDGNNDHIVWHESNVNDLGDGTAAWELPCAQIGNPAWVDGVTYTISARAYDKAGNESSKEDITVTIDQSSPPSTPEVTIRKEGDDIVLSWPHDDSSTYQVYYKANAPYFSEGDPGVDVDGNVIIDGSEATYRHLGVVDPTNVPFIIDNNFFYFVVALSPTNVPSDPSNRVGEFDFELIYNNGIPSVNAVTLVLDPAQMQMDAEGLANDIPNCSSVAEWVAETQSYNEHPIGVPFNNFETKVSYPYFVTVTADGVWTQVGGVPEEGSPEFALIHNNGIPSVNAISVKLNRDDIVDAEGLANDIPNCSSAAEWVAETQSYNEHPIGVPFNNFSVKPGYPYFVGMTADQTW